MIARILFWLRGEQRQAFWYKRETGNHLAFQSYNPFTDRVTFRVGQFGASPMLIHYPSMTRKEWLAMGDNDSGWVDWHG